MAFHREAIGGIIFLTLYCVNFSILLYGYIIRRIRFKSVFTLLLLHVCLRVAAQAVAIALSTKDRLDVGLLIAFFVLGAEGYFSLVLCSYRFVIHHHQHAYPISGSWLEGKPAKNKGNKNDPWYRRLIRALTARDKEGRRDPWVMTWLHWLMIAANTIIIVGGTRTNTSDYGTSDYYDDLRIAGIMRAVGQAIFLVINLFLLSFLLLSKQQDRNPEGTISRGWTKFLRVAPDHGAIDVQQGRRNLDGYTSTMHPTLLMLIIAWPPLVVRGIFGLLQALVDPINYANIAAYTNLGFFTTTFTVTENVLAVLPEWFACCLLCATMFTRETWKEPEHTADHEKPDERHKERRALGSDRVDNSTLHEAIQPKQTA